MGVVASTREPREDRVNRHAPKKKAREEGREGRSKRGGDNVQRQNMEVDDNQDDHKETAKENEGSRGKRMPYPQEPGGKLWSARGQQSFKTPSDVVELEVGEVGSVRTTDGGSGFASAFSSEAIIDDGKGAV
ncbi:hypothetical protein TRAPUB_3473 [Trametes pubescens]|uniref:Uncharacterized protein n=1 Tax=Trametes pubescens TaxID=154538 RepID=A0A1M2VDP6_TRAPU|nr:hypothetical protein TRAPUB_3473 [Trametes pubescens]